ncbi:hypothetical protein [Pseudoalteromonas luteoviolacea]|uniref:hypothetical protein n=1 Tax=Pseudoalteromonas luteoviolacea TaxID=43657 RepID=UPI00159F33BB|nr:hypothetical protein [Pseudoalteromonas luteoviolacea]
MYFSILLRANAAKDGNIVVVIKGRKRSAAVHSHGLPLPETPYRATRQTTP